IAESAWTLTSTFPGSRPREYIKSIRAMKYYSLNDRSIRATFKEAVIAGIAPDRGLYFPEEIKALSVDFFRDIESRSTLEIAFGAIKQFIGEELPDKVLGDILERTLDF